MPWHDLAGGAGGGAAPVGCNCTLQQAYHNGNTILLSAADGQLAFTAPAPSDLAVPFLFDIIPAVAGIGGQRVNHIELIGRGILPPIEGSGATTAQIDWWAIAATTNTGPTATNQDRYELSINSIVRLRQTDVIFQVWGNNVGVNPTLQADESATINDTALSLMCNVAGVQTFKRVVRDAGTGILSAP